MYPTTSSMRTKQTWDKAKSGLRELETYTLADTIKMLNRDDLHLKLRGKAKNRTLLKTNPILYKSILEHTSQLESLFRTQGAYRSNYNLSHRIRFLVERNCNIDSLVCKCGRKYTWTSYCRHCPDYKRNQLGKPHTEETKKKMRISTLRYLAGLKGQVIPRYNKNSIALIEAYGQKHGYVFMHAENGGEYFVRELGYFLDGYDPIHNVAIEVDERSHFHKGVLCDRDIQRQKQIEALLGCTFVRLKYD